MPFDSHNNPLVFLLEVHRVLCDVETEFLPYYVLYYYVGGLDP